MTQQRWITDTAGRSPVEGAPDADVQHYALAAWGCGDGMWDYDPRSGVVWYSDRFREMLGYAGDEFGDALESWSSLLHPDDRDRILATFAAHVVGNEAYDVEYRLRSKLGEYRWFRARGRALRDALGKTIRTAGSITDINDLKQREEELRDSEAYNKMLFQESQRAMVVYDPAKDGFISWNAIRRPSR
jgi:PAS domain S-box-containing protein